MLYFIRRLPQCAASWINFCQFSTSAAVHVETFYRKDLIIKQAPPNSRKPLPKQDEPLGFVEVYTDHMLEVDYEEEKGWAKPIIHPYKNFSLDPACNVFHYASELFEGMKAYRGDDNRIRLFRPELNMARMRRTAERSAFPDFDGNELLECMKEWLRIDKDWVPSQKGASLYIRPTMIGTEISLGVHSSHAVKLFVIAGPAGPYFESFEPITLLADPRYIRAAKGGVGAYKMGCNYAPTLKIGDIAEEKGCHQVLWLTGDEQYKTASQIRNADLELTHQSIYEAGYRFSGLTYLMGGSYAYEVNFKNLHFPLSLNLGIPYNFLLYRAVQVTEAGAMNFFVYWKNEKGENELITASLETGVILPGVTRQSILELAREMGGIKVTERDYTMDELRKAVKEKRVYEMFGAGTAVIVIPVDTILYEHDGQSEKLQVPMMDSEKSIMQKVYKTIQGIQYGQISRPQWTVEI